MAGFQSRLQDVDAMANPGKRDSSLKGRWRHRVGTIWSLDNFADVWHFQQRAGRDRKKQTRTANVLISLTGSPGHAHRMEGENNGESWNH